MLDEDSQIGLICYATRVHFIPFIHNFVIY